MSARFEWEFPSNPYDSLFPDVLCNKGLVSPTDAKYVSMAIHSINFPQLISSQGKPGFAPSALIALDWSNVNLLFKTEVQK